MLDPRVVLAFLALGAVGSLHCAGMCGGFAVSLAALGGSRRRVLGRLLVFGVGKALTYVVLGLSIGLVVRSAGGLAGGVAGAQRAVAWTAGVVLVALGLAWLGLLPARRRVALESAFARALGPWRRAAERMGGGAGAFGAGLVTGLLPCGLSWGAFALAVQSDPASAAVGLFLFGLATTPALAAVGLSWALLPARVRSLGVQAAGALLIVLGVLTLARGGLAPERALAGEPVPCHDDTPPPN